MTIVMFLFIILVASGLFLIASDVLKLPRLATGKAMLSASSSRKERVKGMEAMVNGWAVKLAPYVPMDEYKKNRMKNSLPSGVATTCSGSSVSCRPDLLQGSQKSG